MKLESLKASILEDGKIDAAEVAQIKLAIYEDGKIDKEEADFLFELNDACSEAENDPAWASVFIDAICNYLLDDEQSMGEVDENEAKWLISKIDKDGTVDNLEKLLLNTLISRSKSVPEILTNFISKNS
jgi:hypothetical protein